MTEIWKDVKGYEGRYMISNRGQLKSLDREVERGNGKMRIKGRIVKPQPNSAGYLRFSLCKDGAWKSFFIHRLVASAFVENPRNLPYVNHEDCNYLNNNAENLTWCTPRENMRHAIKNGRFDHHYPVLKRVAKQATDKLKKPVIGINIKTGEVLHFESVNDAGRNFNNNHGSISQCCNGIRISAKGYIWKFAATTSYCGDTDSRK